VNKTPRKSFAGTFKSEWEVEMSRMLWSRRVNHVVNFHAACPRTFRSFLYCFKPPGGRPAAAPPTSEGGRGLRPRCRTGPFGTRLATDWRYRHP
jgi:hypothetical protein